MAYFWNWKVMIMAISLLVTHAKSVPKGMSGYVRHGLQLLPIICDPENNMALITIDIMPMCICSDENKYLKLRNRDTNTAMCKRCSSCLFNALRPHEIQKCGNYSNVLCCEHLSMAAVMASQGYFECNAPEPGQEVNRNGSAYIRIGLQLLPIECDQEDRAVVMIDYIPMCICSDRNKYLKPGNAHDTDSAQCTSCSSCDSDKLRPYEVQKCGVYSNVVCCEHSNMTVVMEPRGSFECEAPEPDQGMNKSDDSVHFQCENGHFLNNSKECVSCTVCAHERNTPYQIVPCSNISNTLCCDKSDSQFRKTDNGFECVSPVSDDTQDCDHLGGRVVNENGKDFCICPDGSHANTTDGHLDCTDTSGKGDVHGKDPNMDNADPKKKGDKENENEDSDEATSGRVIIVVIAVVFVAASIALTFAAFGKGGKRAPLDMDQFKKHFPLKNKKPEWRKKGVEDEDTRKK